MGYKFNPFVGGLDAVDSPNGVFEALDVNGDIVLDDGGTFTTTLQTITPTANRTVSLPNATGTVALVAGSSGQITYNNAGANAGVSTFTADSSGRLTNSASSASGFPVKLWNGTIFAGTTPHVLVQPSAASAGAWSANGTALGVNTAAGFAGRLIDCQVNGSILFNVDNSAASETRIFTSLVSVAGNIRQTGGGFSISGNNVGVRDSGTFEFWSGIASSPSVVDLRLFRDAAGTLAQRNGTAAQAFRVYNTFTSSTNYELGKLEWFGNAFRVGTDKGSGGGTARALEFQTDGTTRATIDSEGDVGIGTSTSGVFGFNPRLAVGKAINAGESVFQVYGISGDATDRNLINGSSTSGDRFYVRLNGNVVNLNNSYGAISDLKLKENIVDANSQWDDLKALQVRKFNFKESQGHTQIGLVAQEVELVSPGLVTESPDRDEEGNDLGTVTKSVNYSVLYMKAIKALQEAMERIETLEAKVAAFEAS